MNAPYTPTPAEIAAAAAKIRESWSEAEHRQRAFGGTLDDWRSAWTPPVVDAGDASAPDDGDD